MANANKKKVLLIDDDVELVEMLRDYLEHEGFEVVTATDGDTGIQLAENTTFAIAIVDVMMEGTNGFEVLRQIRKNSTLPILMLTARGDDTDRIVGLELGADDYVPKPCSSRELTARIRAILKRTQHDVEAPRALKAGLLTLYPEQRKVEWDGNAIDLTSTEFNLLEVLARHAGQVVGKQALSEQALGRPMSRLDRSIDMHMCNIRQKLSQFQVGRSCIQTIVRKGYVLVKE